MGQVPEITFEDFAALARRRGLTLDFLIETFRGRFGARVGDVRDFFERVFMGRYADNVIPYRAVIELYLSELGVHQAETGRERRCSCGCGQRVFDRRRYASNACRQRGHRQRIGDRQNSPEKPAYFLHRNVTVSGGPLPTPQRYVST
jgi:hypothetical protein